ncbi:hypothetical protein IAR55_003430 [Kwoniella newhampshirensis]|uniref:MPN domain-containing protein n=1 Tax=Kwoniella newhampshirensis TaxID=1651941 RepID=A0AAW0YNM6_9TREE
MSSPSPTYLITPAAYALPILHAAAHPSSTVIGLFLASSSSTSTSTSGPDAREIKVDDAIPLIHNYTNLSPMMEISLELADEYAKSISKTIAGVYVGREEGDGLGRIGEKLLAKLKEGNDDAFAFVIDNDKLGSGQPAYIPYVLTSPTSFKSLSSTSSTSLPSPFTLASESLPKELIRTIREKKVFRELRDFDDHLEDSSHDWLENKPVKIALRQHSLL